MRWQIRKLLKMKNGTQLTIGALRKNYTLDVYTKMPKMSVDLIYIKTLPRMRKGDITNKVTLMPVPTMTFHGLNFEQK